MASYQGAEGIPCAAGAGTVKCVMDTYRRKQTDLLVSCMIPFHKLRTELYVHCVPEYVIHIRSIRPPYTV